MLSASVDSSMVPLADEIVRNRGSFSSDESFELIYTEKEKALHIHGPKTMMPSFKRFHPCTEDISLGDLDAFFENGFVSPAIEINKALIDGAREYIDRNYHDWLSRSKRQDDWRIHYQVNLNDENEMIDHVPILNLVLQSEDILKYLTNLMGTSPSGIFYTQVALRTPTRKPAKPSEDYQEGAEYHLDGNANMYGVRFPDPWTVMVGIALVDITSEEMGNFTVFPGWHRTRNWSSYPIEKQNKTLPNLGTPTKIMLRAGQVVFVHVLLPHRGGRNVLEKTSTSFLQVDDHFIPKNIPSNTREMVFFRFRGEGIAYETNSRIYSILNDPWSEFPILSKHPIQS